MQHLPPVILPLTSARIAVNRQLCAGKFLPVAWQISRPEELAWSQCGHPRFRLGSSGQWRRCAAVLAVFSSWRADQELLLPFTLALELISTSENVRGGLSVLLRRIMGYGLIFSLAEEHYFAKSATS